THTTSFRYNSSRYDTRNKNSFVRLVLLPQRQNLSTGGGTMVLQPCVYVLLSFLQTASSHGGHTGSFHRRAPNDRCGFASCTRSTPAIRGTDASRSKSAGTLISAPTSAVEPRVVPRGRRTSLLHRLSLQNSAGNENDGGGNKNDFSSSSSSSDTNFFNDLESLFPEKNDIGFDDSQKQRLSRQTDPMPTHPEGIDAAEHTSSATISDESLLSSLQKRQNQLKQSSRELLRKWRTGIAKTFVGFTVNEHFYLPESELGYLLSDPNEGNKRDDNRNARGGTPGKNRGNPRAPRELPFDWVRRVSIGSYPRVVCGSAHGSVFVADVELGRLLGVARGVHFHGYEDGGEGSRQSDGMHERLRRWLYGDYDGGGVLAVDMYGLNFVASAGREGGVKLFKFVERAKGGGGGVLEFLGVVPTLARPLPGTVPTLVTSLKFDSLGRLFLGGADGYLRMVTFPEHYFGVSDGGGSSVRDESDVKVAVISSAGSSPSPILSLDVSEDILSMSTMIATCHANGNVNIHSVSHEHGNEDVGGAIAFLGTWSPFSSGNTSHARSVAFVSKHDKVDVDRDGGHFGMVVGGGNGEMWVCDLDISSIRANKNTSGSKGSSFLRYESTRKINPLHNGPVLALATRPGGIVISAAHDGLLRVSQVWNDENDQAGGKDSLPKSLYGLMGYKVWIGNICIDDDGKRLISDGKDDVVVVHDFSKDPLEDDGNPGS
ncbi:hypothetical protein ACHAXS_006917, partial [Conticribra weissflogii]